MDSSSSMGDWPGFGPTWESTGTETALVAVPWVAATPLGHAFGDALATRCPRDQWVRAQDFMDATNFSIREVFACVGVPLGLGRYCCAADFGQGLLLRWSFLSPDIAMWQLVDSTPGRRYPMDAEEVQRALAAHPPEWLSWYGVRTSAASSSALAPGPWSSSSSASASSAPPAEWLRPQGLPFMGPGGSVTVLLSRARAPPGQP